MRARPPCWPPSRFVARSAAALLLAAALAPAVTASPAAAAPGAGPQFQDRGSSLTLRIPAVAATPGYTIDVTKSPFQITTQRGGGTVLQTTAGVAASSGPADFRTASGWQTATAVQNADWHDGVLDLTLATTTARATVDVPDHPAADRYRVTCSVKGGDRDAGGQPLRGRIGRSLVRPRRGADRRRRPVHRPAVAAGHRHGRRRPRWARAEYLMTDPFWFTQRGTGHLGRHPGRHGRVAEQRSTAGVVRRRSVTGSTSHGRDRLRRAHAEGRLRRLHRHHRHAGQERRRRRPSTPSRCGTRGRSSTRASSQDRRSPGPRACTTPGCPGTRSSSTTAG